MTTQTLQKLLIEPLIESDITLLPKTKFISFLASEDGTDVGPSFEEDGSLEFSFHPEEGNFKYRTAKIELLNTSNVYAVTLHPRPFGDKNVYRIHKNNDSFSHISGLSCNGSLSIGRNIYEDLRKSFMRDMKEWPNGMLYENEAVNGGGG